MRKLIFIAFLIFKCDAQNHDCKTPLLQDVRHFVYNLTNLNRKADENNIGETNFPCGISAGRPASADCSKISQNLINSIETDQKNWPWQVMLIKNGKKHCGATLINSNYALTAAHCTHETNILDLEIVGDVNNYREVSKGFGKWSKISQIITHPWNNFITKEHDISLLKLENNLVFNQHFRPICLPDHKENIQIGQACYQTGWGDTTYGDKRNISFETYKNLREVCLPYIPKKRCKQILDIPPASFFTSDMICAGDRNKMAACHGDSGGPLMCFQNGKWALIGVMNRIRKCGITGRPGIFADVRRYVTWIKNQTRSI